MLRYIAYIILGAGITAYTYYITSAVDTPPAIYLFFVVGFTLTVYGAYRFMRSLIFSQSHNTSSADQEVIRCPRCGVKHYTSSNYCHKCGAEL